MALRPVQLPGLKPVPSFTHFRKKCLLRGFRRKCVESSRGEEASEAAPGHIPVFPLHSFQFRPDGVSQAYDMVLLDGHDPLDPLEIFDGVLEICSFRNLYGHPGDNAVVI